ncbi:glutathione synthase/ribosomal protein S6 modification enzyme (glutaminyl transferase) [Thioflavicoccus mobilis 8321]|uniref:Glutathione synthase/ribosomal protein S6 modification enzyme (Glutaminyl transferase) n=1 Tax=Thioflavicoccus mobilis 8321 TaxID=765912 RepID=L0GUQ4_9GAMM|nr:glutathione synthase/ribosomal protein S6 modification enzyme (glutaminyl transferase) [Thioflavicoccus mobilis 8321]
MVRRAIRLVSFDAFRSLGIPGVSVLKPEDFIRQRVLIEATDWVLFPQTWQLNVLCYAWKRRVFPSPSTYDIGYDKVEQTRVFESLAPAHVPRTLIRAADEGAIEQAIDELGLPLVVKEPRNAMGRGVHLLETRSALRAWCAQHPVLYAQEYLPLSADLRVVWVGDRVLTAYWRRGGDGFHHNIACSAILDYEAIPGAALELLAALARTLGIDHAGFDIAWMDGHPYLLELNVLFGNAGLRQAGVDIAGTIVAHLHERVGSAI